MKLENFILTKYSQILTKNDKILNKLKKFKTNPKNLGHKR